MTFNLILLFRRWLVRKEVKECYYRASMLSRWGDPEAAADQVNRARALADVLSKEQSK